MVLCSKLLKGEWEGGFETASQHPDLGLTSEFSNWMGWLYGDRPHEHKLDQHAQKDLVEKIHSPWWLLIEPRACFPGTGVHEGHQAIAWLFHSSSRSIVSSVRVDCISSGNALNQRLLAALTESTGGVFTLD